MLLGLGVHTAGLGLGTSTGCSQCRESWFYSSLTPLSLFSGVFSSGGDGMEIGGDGMEFGRDGGGGGMRLVKEMEEG